MAEEPDLSNDAYELWRRARGGDTEAILALLHHANAFANYLADVAFYGTDEAKEAVRGIAGNEVTWPAVVSRHGRITGNAEGIKIYLDHIGLGSERNLNREAADARTHDRLAGAMRLLDQIRAMGCEPRRDFMERDKWIASDSAGHGKAVILAIKDAVAPLYKFDGWREDEAFAPLLARAQDEARRHARAKQYSTVSDAAILRELALDVAKIIHGMLVE